MIIELADLALPIVTELKLFVDVSSVIDQQAVPACRSLHS